MTDDNGVSDGPYKVIGWLTGSCALHIEGPGFENIRQELLRPFDMPALLNMAYANGCKAERERCLRILRSHQGKCEEILLTDYLETPF